MTTEQGPRALVCGSRSGRPTPEDRAWLIEILRRHRIVEVVHGGATGYDSWAGEVAKELGLPVKVFPAHWRGHDGAYRPWAGPERNRMAVRYICRFTGSFVVAFPGGTGTGSTIWYAEKLGVEIMRPTK